MKPAPRFNAATLGVATILGLGVGLLWQEWRSGAGYAPFSPPISLPSSLLVIAALLTFLALRLKSAIEHKDGERVNPFHAVRLLAAARASQITGVIFAGFAVGLLLIVIGRTVGVRAGVWIPMAATLIAGILLLVAGIYAESICRVPPQDDDETQEMDAPEIA